MLEDINDATCERVLLWVYQRVEADRVWKEVFDSIKWPRTWTPSDIIHKDKTMGSKETEIDGKM